MCNTLANKGRYSGSTTLRTLEEAIKSYLAYTSRLHEKPPTEQISGLNQQDCRKSRSEMRPLDASKLLPYFSQPRRRKYTKGAIALASISANANG